MTKDELILSQISLSHGQARWVLKHFNMLSGETEATFDAFLKSLRRDGVPFAPEELGKGRGQNVVYRYEHLMELALAMTLRTQGVIARDIVRLIPKNREKLRYCLRRAYLERDTGLGAPKRIYATDPDRDLKEDTASKRNAIRELNRVSGTYLDLKIIYTTGGGLAVLNLDLLGPLEAIDSFMIGHQNLYPRPPIPISDIAVDIVRLAEADMPEFRRGRR